MANNSLPQNPVLLIGLGCKMHTGILELGMTIPITMLTAAQLQSALDAFVASDGAFNAARSARQAASEGFQAKAGKVYDWLLAVSNMLATLFGTRWSTAWAQAGFVNYSTGIPSKVEERLGLVLALVDFFKANPGYEVASMKLTAAEGTALRAAALAAQQAATAAKVTLDTIGLAWTSAYDALTALMRKLIKNLEGMLAKDDPRWLVFGLQIPATNTTPGQPENLTVTVNDAGNILAACEAVPYGARYRWRTRLVGQVDYQLAASTTDPLALIPGVLPGQTVEVIVQAVNGSLQGVASNPVVFTQPPVAAAVPKRAVAVTETAPPAGYTNGNGNGNGQARYARAA